MKAVSEAEWNWVILRLREVDCYRFDAEWRTMRRVRVNARRLYTPREAVRYLELAYGIEITIDALREAVFVGDLDCHFLKTAALDHRRRCLRLARAAMRFTTLQLRDSDWLCSEQHLRRVELEQGPLAARRIHEFLRHPGRPPARFEATPAPIDDGARREH